MDYDDPSGEWQIDEERAEMATRIASLEAKLAAAEKRADDEATVARTQEARAWDAEQRTIEAIAVSADREAQQADDDHVREALRFAMANPGGE